MTAIEINSIQPNLSTDLMFHYDHLIDENAAIFIGSKNSGINTIVNSIESLGCQQSLAFLNSLKIYEIQIDIDENISEIIAKAYNIYQVFNNLKSAKIILVIDYKKIDYDEKSFEKNYFHILDLLYKHIDYVDNLFQNKMYNFFSSLVIIFNISNEYNFDYDLDNFRTVAHVYYSMKYQSKETKIFNGYKSRNSINMIFCKTIGPDHIDNLDIQNVIEAITIADSMQGDIIKSITPNLTDTSKACLFKIYEMLSFKNAFSKFEKLLSNFLSEELNQYEIQKTKDPSNDRLFNYFFDIHEIMESDKTLHQKIFCLQGLHPKIEKAIKQNNLDSITKFMEFTDSVLNLRESEYFLKNLQCIYLQKLKELYNNKRIQKSKNAINGINFDKSLRILRYGPKIKKLDAQIKEIQQYNDEIKDYLLKLWLDETIAFEFVSAFCDSSNKQINDEIFNIIKKGIDDLQILINSYHINKTVHQIKKNKIEERCQHENKHLQQVIGLFLIVLIVTFLFLQLSSYFRQKTKH